MVKVSSDYRKLDPSEVSAIAAECDKAWQDASIPMLQWTLCVEGELERYLAGERQPHFQIAVDLLKSTGLENPTLLDVGAASGFYRQVLKDGGFACQYTALDYSTEFAKFAVAMFPGIDFRVGDARALPFADNSFDIVLSGCCLIHIYEAEKVIAESARVASKFVLMNRTPVLTAGATRYYEKEAYQVRCLEIHYSESDLLRMFAKYGLTVVAQKDIFFTTAEAYGHRTYLLRK